MRFQIGTLPGVFTLQCTLDRVRCMFKETFLEYVKEKTGKSRFVRNTILWHFSPSGGSHRIGRAQVSGKVSVLGLLDSTHGLFVFRFRVFLAI